MTNDTETTARPWVYWDLIMDGEGTIRREGWDNESRTVWHPVLDSTLGDLTEDEVAQLGTVREVACVPLAEHVSPRTGQEWGDVFDRVLSYDRPPSNWWTLLAGEALAYGRAAEEVV